ncbi:MAG: hypothetical protein OXE44_08530 [Nitrospinae bacterium]|nr:hypothetical protein [Nitrospinota bacterium]
MKRIILGVVTFFCLMTTHSFAQQQTLNEIIHFQLFTNCEPMSLLVGELSKDVLKLGLTKESIKKVAENRLRAARLYSNKIANSYLRIEVRVSGVAFSISILLNKAVFDRFYTQGFGYVTTWSNGFLGTHGEKWWKTHTIGGVKARKYIMSNLTGVVDDFLIEFLRVNDEACRKKK